MALPAHLQKRFEAKGGTPSTPAEAPADVVESPAEETHASGRPKVAKPKPARAAKPKPAPAAAAPVGSSPAHVVLALQGDLATAQAELDASQAKVDALLGAMREALA